MYFFSFSEKSENAHPGKENANFSDDIAKWVTQIRLLLLHRTLN